MTANEFSTEFDVLIEGKLSLDEYEKSVYLTQAQEEIVVALYNGTYKNESFETTEEMRRYLEPLVKTINLADDEKDSNVTMSNGTSFVNSKIFKLPKDLWFITQESVIFADDSLGCRNNLQIEVVPIRQDEYNRIKDNPFRTANERRVLRIDIGSSKVEIISKYKIGVYSVKYLSKPSPIVLEDFSNDNLSINNEITKQSCMLHSALHRLILNRAAQIALSKATAQNNV